MTNKLIEILSEEISKKLIEESFTFPIGNDNFNVGYDEIGLGSGKKRF